MMQSYCFESIFCVRFFLYEDIQLDFCVHYYYFSFFFAAVSRVFWH
jgi:hypothetical protein